MRGLIVLKFIGYMLMVFSFFFIPPLIMTVFLNESDWMAFLNSGLITFFIGFVLSRLHQKQVELRRSDGFLIVVLVWATIGFFAILPFVLSDINVSFIDAFFEATSGITTTGASVFRHLNKMPYGIQFYHQELQFIGGLGVVAIASALLPLMKIGGIHLYFADMPGPSKEQKLLPQLSDGMATVCKIYLASALFCFVGYFISGLTLFESVCEMFSTVSTGGFTLNEESFTNYNVYTQVIAIICMIFGAINFQLHYLWIFKKQISCYWQDIECVRFFQLLTIISLIVFGILMHYRVYDDPNTTFINTVFNVVSLITTSGLIVGHFSDWPSFLPELMVVLSMIGACGGSTAGGIKIIRVIICSRQSVVMLRKLIHPSAIIKPTIKGSPIREEMINSVMAFMVLYFYIFVTLIILMIGTGLDLFNSFAAIAACISNVGVGINQVSYNEVHYMTKIIMIFAMLIGRIEIMTFFAILLPSFWRS